MGSIEWCVSHNSRGCQHPFLGWIIIYIVHSLRRRKVRINNMKVQRFTFFLVIIVQFKAIITKDFFNDFLNLTTVKKDFYFLPVRQKTRNSWRHVRPDLSLSFLVKVGFSSGGCSIRSLSRRYLCLCTLKRSSIQSPRRRHPGVISR